MKKLNPVQKLRLEIQNPINWKRDKCVICKFPMKLKPTNHTTSNNELTFDDFIIRYEHKFLRNIYTTEQIEQSDQIFKENIMICIGWIALLNNFNRDNFINLATKEFVEERFAGDDIRDIKNTINQTDIKNDFLMTRENVFKFNLKIYAYVYKQLLIFPPSEIEYEIITTNKFFLHVHWLIRGKVLLHHSHTTGNIIGYAHDFCNMAFVEKCSPEIPFLAHNLFGFDLFYFVKTYIASAWCSKELNIDGNNLTHANYGNISSEIKLIEINKILKNKFYQQSLGELSSTFNTWGKNSC